MIIDKLINNAKQIEPELNNSNLDSIIEDLISKNNFFILDNNYKELLYPDFKIVVFNENSNIATHKILQDIKEYEEKNKTGKIKPIITTCKLANKEYIININSIRYIYIIDVNQHLLDNKSFIKEYLLISKLTSLKNLVDYINSDDKIIDYKNYFNLLTSNINNTKIEKYKFTKNDEQRYYFIKQVFDNIKFNENDLNDNFVLLQDIMTYKYNFIAYDILYMYHESKEKFVNICRDICNKYYKNMKIGVLHNQYINLPTEFRLNKSTIFIESKKRINGKTEKIFICNLYNFLSYTVIPCYKLPKRNYFLTDSIISQKFNYINLIYLNVIKSSKIENITKYIQNNIYNTFVQLENGFINNYDIEWVGIYRDEDYDIIKYNQKNKNENNFEIII